MLKFTDISNIRYEINRTGGGFQGRILFEVGADTCHVWVDHDTLALGIYYGRYDKKGLYRYPTDAAARKTTDTQILNLEAKATAKALAAVVAEVRKLGLPATAIAEVQRLEAEADEKRRQEKIEKTKKAFHDMLLYSLEQGLMPPAKVNEIERVMIDVKPESWLILRSAVLGA
ncbi:hypothetical protein HOU00_gp234 [Caulobacter phage CcrPW]|uniref:Uncharacterized protein n=1 Tax=Caulobacter phage CcrPW TaxID=2283271 RepID=A0A385EAH9_9CAUD|nr:hypothetical protein HOU00_gp234 [Caulobacter phage CcrPW]AXQ68891.1 hypothetical protein CcrPW_gp352 [Caulobacter phage CcrPW]